MSLAPAVISCVNVTVPPAFNAVCNSAQVVIPGVSGVVSTFAYVFTTFIIVLLYELIISPSFKS